MAGCSSRTRMHVSITVEVKSQLEIESATAYSRFVPTVTYFRTGSLNFYINKEPRKKIRGHLRLNID